MYKNTDMVVKLNMLKRAFIPNLLAVRDTTLPITKGCDRQPYRADFASAKFGFTLMELMIVVVIMGIIAAFSIPNYSKAVERSYERDGMVNLLTIYTSQKIYNNNNNAYASGKDIAALNSLLELGLIANGMSYACNSSTLDFECTATRGKNTFVLKVNKDRANPCCLEGNCPSIEKCAS